MTEMDSKQMLEVRSIEIMNQRYQAQVSSLTAGPFTFHTSHMEPDLKEMIVSVADLYNRHTGSIIINVSLT